MQFSLKMHLQYNVIPSALHLLNQCITLEVLTIPA